MPYSVLALTLAQLLESEDDTIRRNAKGILKLCQRCEHHEFKSGRCSACFLPDIVEQARIQEKDE